MKNGYLQEFMYRRKYGDNVLDMILKHIKEIYPWMPRKYKKKQTEVTNIFSRGG